ncbi:MAG: hypothetical protein JWL95_2185 [Gemmatimonadetes bacterium]|nr:hypothetical protein [Gemmatimonadota bacterium]
MRPVHWRSVFGALTAFLMMAVVACGSDTSTGPGSNNTPTTPVGSYSLSAVNGKPVPVTMFSDTAFTEVIADATLALTADGKYLFVQTTHETVAGYLSVYVYSSSGTWKQQGSTSAITFTSTDAPGPDLNATWTGNTISLLGADAVTWVFTRK